MMHHRARQHDAASSHRCPERSRQRRVMTEKHWNITRRCKPKMCFDRAEGPPGVRQVKNPRIMVFSALLVAPGSP